MKSKVKNWLEGKLGKKPKHAAQHRHPEDLVSTDLPRLPSTRAHTLTPSPSNEVLAAAATGSRFFEKLPVELRRQILVLAVGGRTVHMDLSFGHPIIPLAAGGSGDGGGGGSDDGGVLSHAGINADMSTFPPAPNWDRGAPQSWRWWGSVCHRALPEHLRSPIDRYRGVQEPGGDYCRFGGPHHCQAWPGKYPLKCRIGVMGWLLSCRQAYTEGIDVLYATNTIHISSAALLSRHIPELLLPQRLHAITSLEIVWPLELLGRGRRQGDSDPSTSYSTASAVPGEGKSDHSDLESLLNDVLSADVFPRLARLHLALKTTSRRGGNDNDNNRGRVALQNFEARVLAPVDAFVLRRRRQGLAQFTLSPSRSVFAPLFEAAAAHDSMRRAAVAGAAHRLSYLPSELWRNLSDGSYVMVLIMPGGGGDGLGRPLAERMASPYPRRPSAPPPLSDGGGVAGSGVVVGDGYWILQGDVDDESRIHYCSVPG